MEQGEHHLPPSEDEIPRRPYNRWIGWIMALVIVVIVIMVISWLV